MEFIVNERMQTSAPDIFAAGDVANAFHPVLSDRLRSEHWANAVASGKVAASSMLEGDAILDGIPYFYTDQYDLGMEYSGYGPLTRGAELIVRGDRAAREFIAFWVADNRVVAGMNMNVWDVNDQVQRLIRDRVVVDAPQLANKHRQLGGNCMIHRIGKREFDFSKQVAVMAVVNRTPDSFSDRGATFLLERAVEAAVKAAGLGADWIDIGGVPFGRGPEVSTAEEIDRVVPVIAAIADVSDVVISVDTNRAEVAAAAIAAGAAVINDTSGLGDPDMAGVVARSGAHVVITHSVGPPRTEKPPAYFDDVIAEVRQFLTERVERAIAAGVSRERIIIDPGHDLDKNTLHTLEITRRLDEIADIGLPLLVAVSNKDFIGESIDREQGKRLAGSIAAMTACIERGARIVRMHDVEATVDAVRMTEAILGFRAPVRLEHNTHPTRNV